MVLITQKCVYCIVQTKSLNIIQINLAYLSLSVCRMLLWLLCMTSLMISTVIFVLQKFWISIQYLNHCLSFETASQVQQLLRSLLLDLPGLFPESKRNSLCKDFHSWLNHVTLFRNLHVSKLFHSPNPFEIKDFIHFTRNLHTWNEVMQIYFKHLCYSLQLWNRLFYAGIIHEKCC